MTADTEQTPIFDALAIERLRAALDAWGQEARDE